MYNARTASELTIGVINQPGELSKIFRLLSDSGVNVLAYTAYVEGGHGFIKCVPDDPDKASASLDSAGINHSAKPVILIDIPDKIGSGADVAAVLANAGINITHSHGSSAGYDKALLVINTTDNASALMLLQK